MIDTHCHIDLYSDPLRIANECERLGIVTIGMTNLPSYFEMGYIHLLSFKKVRLALGMHPLYAEYHKREFPKFLQNISKTSFIGEIGLDFSKEGIPTKEIQLDSFKKILSELNGKKKLLSLHSRKAEKEVLNYLIEYDIKSAIFHWYSGPLSLIDEIVKAGYYFSINPAMIKSKSGQDIIRKIPIDRTLTESDGPFIKYKGKPIKPSNMKVVEDYLAILHKSSYSDIVEIINQNFKRLISNIR